ncbi:hypothetical protein QJQ45_023427 [Haematococcus lacustris]|nr:hypothetical protein QJQ45_023427 [Haematococcus lacustris]
MEGATINGEPTITSTFSASAGASVGNTENNTESSEAEQYALSLSLSVSKYMSDAEAATQAEMLGELRTQRDVAHTAWRAAELAVVRLRRESELGMEKQRAWVEGLVAPTAKPAAVNGGGLMNGNGVPGPPPILSFKSAVTPVHAAARMSTETLSPRSSPLSASGPELLDWLVAKVAAGDLQPQCDKCEQDVEVAHFMRRVRELKEELSRCEQELREAEQLEAYQREGYQKAAGALALKEQAVQRERAERERLVRRVRDELSAQASRAREQQAAEARVAQAAKAQADAALAAARAQAQAAEQLFRQRFSRLQTQLGAVQSIKREVRSTWSTLVKAVGHDGIAHLKTEDGGSLWEQERSRSDVATGRWPAAIVEDALRRHRLQQQDTGALPRADDDSKLQLELKAILGQAAGSSGGTTLVAQAQASDERLCLLLRQACSRMQEMVVLVDHQLMLGQKLGDQLAAWATGVSPYAAKLDVLQQQCQQREREAAGLAAQKEQLMQQLADLEEADRALGRGGLQSYVLEGLLGELQDLCGAYLAQLCDGMVLELSATTSRLKSGAATPALPSSPAAITAGQAGQSQPAAATNASEIRGRAAGEAAADEGEELEGGEQAAEGEATGRKQRGRARGSRGAQQGRPKESRAEAEGLREEISLTVLFQAPGRPPRQRSLAQLSGGERRRLALALSLGFAALVRRRGRLVCNLLVLDEIWCCGLQVLQQLDGEGCERAAEVLKGLPHDSVLVVGQASSFTTQAFEVVDTVVKSGGGCYIVEA